MVLYYFVFATYRPTVRFE